MTARVPDPDLDAAQPPDPCNTRPFGVGAPCYERQGWIDDRRRDWLHTGKRMTYGRLTLAHRHERVIELVLPLGRGRCLTSLGQRHVRAP
jgi:hypothetical protein